MRVSDRREGTVLMKRISKDEKIGVYSIIKPYSMTIITQFTSNFIDMVIGLVIPLLTAVLVDEVFYHQVLNSFMSIAYLYILLFFSQIIFRTMGVIAYQNISNTMVNQVKIFLFEKIIYLKADQLGNHGAGAYMQYFSDADELLDLVDSNTVDFLNTIFKFLFSFVLVILISWKATLIMIAVTPVAALLYLWLGKKIEKVYSEYREHLGKYNSWIFNILLGLREIHMISGSHFVTKKFIQKNAQITEDEVKKNKLAYYSETSKLIAAFLVNVVLFIVMAYLVFWGEITVGIYLAIVQYYVLTVDALSHLVDLFVSLRQKIPNIRRVLAILNEPNELEDEAEDYRIRRGDVQFKHVCFSYNGKGHEVLKDFDFTVKSGQTVALVGNSGAGKSTVASLLLKLFEPDQGRITIDGVNIAQISARSLRRQIGVVQQEPIIFDDTLANNLLLAKKDASMEEMIRACKKANLYEDICQMPDGFEQMLGNGAMELSGGQKQRLAIARVFLKDAPIVIWDEATSSLDSENEMAVHKALDALKRNRAILVIAHRASAIRQCDTAVILNHGRIESNGPAEEILQSYILNDETTE